MFFLSVSLSSSPDWSGIVNYRSANSLVCGGDSLFTFAPCGPREILFLPLSFLDTSSACLANFRELSRTIPRIFEFGSVGIETPRMLTSNCVFNSTPHVVKRVEDDLATGSFKVLPSMKSTRRERSSFSLSSNSAMFFPVVRIEQTSA